MKSINFYEIILKEILKIKCKKAIIPFPLIYYRLGTIFHFNKRTSKIILKILEEKGLIKIIPFKGVKVNDERVQKLRGVRNKA